MLWKTKQIISECLQEQNLVRLEQTCKALNAEFSEQSFKWMTGGSGVYLVCSPRYVHTTNPPKTQNYVPFVQCRDVRNQL